MGFVRRKLTVDDACGKMEKRCHVERFVMPKVRITQDKLLTAFVDRMLEDKGVKSADRRELVEQRRKLMEELEQYVNVAVIEALPDEKFLLLEKRLEEGVDDDELDEIFEGVDYLPVAQKAMVEFREEYLGMEGGEK